jgi:SAM-dependent methyltransferase
MSHARAGHYVLGMAGVALVRHWYRDDPEAAARIADLRRLLSDPQTESTLDIPERGSIPGYAEWAATYDALPNPLIQIEEPVVHDMIAAHPPGRAIDAACGTGRHAAHLAKRGHEVVGIDSSEEMLAAARARHPSIDFRRGDLTALPVDPASGDLLTCALALQHVADLRAAFTEFARVIRPGGTIIVSDLHPTMFDLGGGAFYPSRDGGFAVVRSHPRTVSDHVNAAMAAGLTLHRSEERPWGKSQVPLCAGPLYALAPEAFDAALTGIPGALILELRR